MPAPPDTLSEAAARLASACAATATTVAVAESCTGGLIAKCCTDLPGASAWFDAGFVVYSNRAKTESLNVPAELIAREGAVSEACVRALIAGLRTHTPATRLCAVSGVAGPGHSERTAPGVVWFGIATPAQEHYECQTFPGDRDAVRTAATAHALARLAAP